MPAVRGKFSRGGSSVTMSEIFLKWCCLCMPVLQREVYKIMANTSGCDFLNYLTQFASVKGSGDNLKRPVQTGVHSCKLSLSCPQFLLDLKWVYEPRPQTQTRPERVYKKMSVCVLAVDPGRPGEVGQAWNSMSFHFTGRSPSGSKNEGDKLVSMGSLTLKRRG